MTPRRARASPDAAELFDRASRGTVVDLFAGAGGISEGFRQAGFKIIAGSDYDPDATATYALNFPGADVVTGDIRQSTIKQRILSAAKDASIVVGGPPCQAFSQVRNFSRMIDDPRNSLYREFVDVISAARPVAFLMENVTGIDELGMREQMLSDLSIGGAYKVRGQVVNAADFGVPQTRKRLLFIGLREELSTEPPELRGTRATDAVSLARFNGVAPAHYKIVAQTPLDGKNVLLALKDKEDKSVVSAADAISDLAGLPVGNRLDELPCSELAPAATAYQREMRKGAGKTITNVQVPRINVDTAIRLESIPPGGNHRDLPDELLERYISGQKWGQDNGSGKLSRRHFYAYRRLHPGIWAWTLTTKGDCVYHYKHARALSVREFARLQSFPDRFTFTTDPRVGQIEGRHSEGAAHSRYRQVGNAVPPLLAKAAAQAIRASLRKALSSEGLKTLAA